MRTRRKKHSRLWLYLLYLGLVTSLILSVTLARYSSSTGGTGIATVAAVAGGGGEVEGQPIQMLLEGLHPGGEEKSLTFQVVNYSGDTVSEVAMSYRITVETTGNLPLTFTLTAQGDDTGAVPTGAIAGGTILTGSAHRQVLTGGAFPLTGEKQAHTYTLTAAWSGENNSELYAQELDLVTVTVLAWQRLSTDR